MTEEREVAGERIVLELADNSYQDRLLFPDQPSCRYRYRRLSLSHRLTLVPRLRYRVHWCPIRFPAPLIQ